MSQNKLTAALFLEHDDVKHTVVCIVWLIFFKKKTFYVFPSRLDSVNVFAFFLESN